MKTDRGILFAATGAPYFAEAREAARRVREVLPEMAVAIASDRDHGSDGVFDSVISLAAPRFTCGDKIEGTASSPFVETLFLDPDTYLAADPSPAFDLLARYPFAVSHAPFRDAHPLPGIPESFPEPNSGVMVFRQGEDWQRIHAAWRENYEILGMKNDQPALRKALWDGGERFAVLAPEYQFRTSFPAFAGEGSLVRVIHGRHADPARIARELNASTHARLYLRGFRSVFSPEVVSESRLHRILKRILRRRK